MAVQRGQLARPRRRCICGCQGTSCPDGGRARVSRPGRSRTPGRRFWRPWRRPGSSPKGPMPRRASYRCGWWVGGNAAPLPAHDGFALMASIRRPGCPLCRGKPGGVQDAPRLNRGCPWSISSALRFRAIGLQMWTRPCTMSTYLCGLWASPPGSDARGTLGHASRRHRRGCGPHRPLGGTRGLRLAGRVVLARADDTFPDAEIGLSLRPADQWCAGLDATVLEVERPRQLIRRRG